MVNEPEVTVEESTEETTETTQNAYDDLTLDEARERLAKAEKALYTKKKEEKAKKKDETPQVAQFDESILDKKLEERDFFRANPDLAEYKDQIKEYTSEKISLSMAADFFKRNDEAYKNRQKTAEMNIIDGESGGSKTVYTSEDLKKLSQSDYDKVMAQVQKGKYTLKA